MTRQRTFYLSVFAVLSCSLLVFFAGVYWYCSPFRKTLDQILISFDPTNPGRGPDAYKKEIMDHAEAYAMIASLFARLEKAVDAKVAVDWLINDLSKNNRKGWGLPFAWDAFGDGSINSENTVYGVSAALGVRALIDVCELTQETHYCTKANEALDYYKQFFTNTEDGGYFWYSDQGADASYDVYNVSALLMAQYARGSKVFHRADYMELAKKAFGHVWLKRNTDNLGVWWTYGQHRKIPNDLVHAALMIEGISDFAKYASVSVELGDTIRYLEKFITVDGIKEFVGPGPELSNDLLKRPARVWGLGALIGTLSIQNRPLLARQLIDVLKLYEFSPGAYGMTPTDTTAAPILKAYVAKGLLDSIQEGCIPCRYF